MSGDGKLLLGWSPLSRDHEHKAVRTTAFVLNAATGELLYTVALSQPPNGQKLPRPCFSPDSRYLFVCQRQDDYGFNKRVEIRSAITGVMLTEPLESHENRSTDAGLFFVRAFDRANNWSIQDRRAFDYDLSFNWEGFNDAPPKWAALSPDGSVMASKRSDDLVQTWDVRYSLPIFDTFFGNDSDAFKLGGRLAPMPFRNSGGNG